MSSILWYLAPRATLAQRKLLPALFHRDLQGQIPPGGRIIGSSRRAMTREDFRAFALAAIEAHVPVDTSQARDVQAVSRPPGLCGGRAKPGDAGWEDLEKNLKPNEDRIRVFYLAVGPDLFGPICERLGSNNLVTPKSRVVVEKPSASTAPRPRP